MTSWLDLLTQATESAIDASLDDFSALITSPILASILVLLATGGQDAKVALIELASAAYAATHKTDANH